MARARRDHEAARRPIREQRAASWVPRAGYGVTRMVTDSVVVLPLASVASKVTV